MAFDKAKFLTRFTDEAKEHVSRLSEGLQILGKNPDDAETLNAVFRSAHTIKGSARMMKLIPVSHMAHKLEDALDAFRQKKIPPSEELSDLLFQATDAIDSMLDRISAGGEIIGTPENLCHALERAAMGEVISASVSNGEVGARESMVLSAEKGTDAADKTAGLTEIAAAEPVSAESAEAHKTDSAEKEMDQDIGKTADELCRKISSPQSVSHSNVHDENAGKKRSDTDTGNLPSGIKSETIRPETIRIDADKLDQLIKLMGEIVSGHSRTRRRALDIREIEKISKKYLEFIVSLPVNRPLSPRQRKELLSGTESLCLGLKKLSALFKEDISVQGILTSDLQDRSLKMRMVPLSTIFSSFSRTVRQLSRSFGKHTDFTVEGGETELDKKIIEKIGDPLLHMIRNCIDHGIETPEERKKAGKAETGIIRLTAGYEGENVLIRLSDDGAGIPLNKIKEKALRKKIFTAAEIESIPESEIISLIFLPGFSSSDIVTDISGRGVGMDVVKKNVIEELKGSIQIETAEGKGTVFHIRLPLTMAVIHVLFIRVEDMVFAVPAGYTDEIIRINREKLIQVMERRAVRLRGQIIPIVRLRDILSLPGERPVKPETEYLILITSAGSEKLGVIIDALLDEEDMVIRPLPAHMRNIPFVSGCIISGGNEIFSVLHMPRIIESAREVRVRTRTERKPADKPRHILVVDDSLSTREIEKSILESYGYTVSLAGDGIEGYEKARKNRYDLVITDVEMPKMDGFSLTQKLREEEDCRDIPIILVTSLDKEEDKKRGILAGADAYIVKGDFEQSALLDTVRNLLG
ncbi:MAG: response regulator [Desulfococcaceae bacterium]